MKYCERCVCVMSSNSAHKLIQIKNRYRIHTYKDEAENIYIYMYVSSINNRLTFIVESQECIGGWSKVRERQTEKDKKKTLAPKSNSLTKFRIF